jgi:hypothetical protein
MDLDLNLGRIEEAARTVDPVFLNTPQYADAQLSTALGRDVVVKVETANPLRSFKGRGADFFMAHVDPRAEDPHHWSVRERSAIHGPELANRKARIDRTFGHDRRRHRGARTGAGIGGSSRSAGRRYGPCR